ncbi:MAG: ATP synthase F1 subunit gamma [Bacteroidales bacterium]|nr:ATP synthase F1 subunit gamma [Bacteroidales bacterium]
MATLRELKGRIGSVASSEKITGAMKMISSAKMHKAEGALRRLKPYRSNIETIIANLLTADATFTSPLTETRTLQRVTMVVLGSDDGLCGAYNVNLVKFLDSHIRELRSDLGEDLHIDIVAIGRKMIKACARLSDARTTVTTADDINSKSEGDEVKKFEFGLRDAFLKGDTDAVELVYMNYQSAGRQRPAADRLLPLSSDAFATEGIVPSARPYIFEPDAQTIFSSVLPMYLLALTQEVFVENRASEQAARVMAMQAANDNAKKLLDQLRLEYNKLRQQSITTELLDIVGGQVRD